MTFGGPTDEATAGRIVAKAREQGVNFIDSADAYQGGKSEEIAGRAIGNQRHDWVVATKLANQMGEGANRGGLSRKWVMQAAEESLRRLGTDYIDIYYLHKEDHATPLAETVRAIGDLLRAGQDPLFRRVELPLLARRRDLQSVRPHGHRPADREPALLSRALSRGRGRASAGVRRITASASSATRRSRAACSPENISRAPKRRRTRARDAPTGA